MWQLGPVARLALIRLANDVMAHHIKHNDDHLRILRQDIEREKLVTLARYGENRDEADIFEGYTKSRDTEGGINVAIAMALVALAAIGSAMIIRSL